MEAGIILAYPIIDACLIQTSRERSSQNVIDNLVGASRGIKLGSGLAQLTPQRLSLMLQMLLCFLCTCLFE